MCRRENKLRLTEHYVFWRQNKRQSDSAMGGGNPIGLCSMAFVSVYICPDKRVFGYFFSVMDFLVNIVKPFRVRVTLDKYSKGL